MADIRLEAERTAKKKFRKMLEEKGYCNVSSSNCADFKATKDGVTHYFELKVTSQEKRYFGAATATEWRQAYKTPSLYHFVIAKRGWQYPRISVY